MFILGSANFGNYYPGSVEFVDEQKAHKIISKFVELGGIEIDSAEVYGNSLSIIEKFNDLDFKVGTKFSSELMLHPSYFSQYLLKLVEKFKSRLSYCLLHDVQYVSEIPKQSIKILENFLAENSGVKFGVSIYWMENFELAKKNIDLISIVQAPLNYFDRRFVSSEFKQACKHNNVKINYRSVFLQGKLLEPIGLLHPYFKKFEQFNLYYSDFLRSNCSTLLEFNIDFVKSLTDFENVVLGVENYQQTSQIARLINKKKKKGFLEKISTIQFDEGLCIPMNWRL